jgi:hypothetical protein
MDITPWMEWFLGCLGRAIDGAQTVLRTVLAKARSWERMKGVAINDRQRLVLNRLLDGFEGKLTTTKYAKLTKSSQDTALRDLEHLVKLSRAFWFAVQKEAAVQVMRLRTFLDRTRSNRGLHPRCSRLATNRVCAREKGKL